MKLEFIGKRIYRSITKDYINDWFRLYSIKILDNSSLLTTAQYIQHGDTSVLVHSLAVAYYSYKLAQLIGIKYSKNELVRGALLHDYFLYDWHKPHPRFHGFRHPGFALKNAEREFDLSDKERCIISNHMFPLTPVPPTCKEGLIVCVVDKVCSTYEVFKKNPYQHVQRKLLPIIEQDVK